MRRNEAESILSISFGLDKFYDGQWDVISRLFNGERILLIEKTGYGKSLCFQFPALLFEGTTIIFSPLIALMRDQVKKLNELGINAKCINSNQTESENKEIIESALQNNIKILYIAPERMENIEWLETAQKLKISMIVVDEAHCISVWGHDFRPSYRRIVNLVKLLPANFPLLATTATATKKVEEDIMKQLGKDVTCTRGNLMRDNFYLFLIKVKSEEEKLIWLGTNLEKIKGSGIIYTGTRINSELYSNWLEFIKISSVFYNSELSPESRIEIEQGLIDNRWKCVVSTNALGMGIDKPDIRFIVHTQIPQSPIHYYQEIGRAGRDGKPAYIILFYNPESDLSLPEAFINTSKPSKSQYDKVIIALKKERLSEKDLMRETNLKQTQIRVIKADLIDQKIINEVNIGRSKFYELKYDAPEFDFQQFEELRISKLEELNKMIEYVDFDGCRMKYLCNYLGDSKDIVCKKCDNDKRTIKTVIVTDDWMNKIDQFRNSSFPILEVETRGTNLINGVAASYYGVSNIGKILHNCKYENGGDFPNNLVSMIIKAFNKHLNNNKFDLILYVPPTESGNLVMNFANKISQNLKIPISHNLIKTRTTKPQKIFQNYILKRDNVQDAFFYSNSNEIYEKSVLLVDDIFDSGASIKEIGKLLTKLGVKLVAPLVIAKTVGGDI